MFGLLVADRNVNRIATSHTSNALAMIRTLTKLSTSPMLLQRKQHEQKDESVKDALALIPGDAKLADMGVSGKLNLVEQLLSYLFKETEEKVILVSHFTSTLDVLQQFCVNRRYNYFRLDGQTPPGKRQEFVDQFNRTSQKQGCEGAAVLCCTRADHVCSCISLEHQSWWCWSELDRGVTTCVD